MSDIQSVSGRGAPLRIFFLVAMIWILSRIALGSDIGLGSMAPGKTNFEPEYSANTGALVMDPMTSRSRHNIDNWPTDSRKITDYDFVKTDLPSWVHSRPWTGLSLTGNQSTNKRIAENNAKPVISALMSDVQSNFALPTQCCKKQSGGLTEYNSALSARRNKKRPIFGSRLSAYLWLFARSGSSVGATNPIGTTLQPGVAQYGGSQAGAILSYRLAGDQRRNMAVYSRVSSPLAVKGETEVAVGAKVKPVKGLPISIYAENRFRENSSNRRATAVFAAGGSGPDEVIPGVFLETYGQAGYVFQKDSSYFFDGSASLQKKLIQTDAGKISLGGALWAGGQEGASRLDIGPRVDIDVPFGTSAIRASVDWRQRVAGNAEPDSGLTVSLSTGF